MTSDMPDMTQAENHLLSMEVTIAENETTHSIFLEDLVVRCELIICTPAEVACACLVAGLRFTPVIRQCEYVLEHCAMACLHVLSLSKHPRPNSCRGCMLPLHLHAYVMHVNSQAACIIARRCRQTHDVPSSFRHGCLILSRFATRACLCRLWKFSIDGQSTWLQ